VEEDQPLADYLAVVRQVSGGEPPGLRPVGGERPELRHGQFHDVVLAGDVAYRFPRDEESRRALPGRMALLRVLETCGLPVATPVPLATERTGIREPLGRCHVALTRLRGEPLPRELATRFTAAVIAELGGLLDALRRLGAEPAVSGAVPTADPGQWERFGADVTQALFPLMSRRGRSRAEAELTRVAAVDPVGSALVHGDLGGTNLLWTLPGSAPHPDSAPHPEPVPRLVGVLDWDEAHLGSPAEDLASLAATFGWPLAEQLVTSGHADDGALQDARAIAATFALQQALPAALSDDQVMLADGLTNYVG
jgi:aminoglycoside phosphotransferase (APT) family kinase protein